MLETEILHLTAELRNPLLTSIMSSLTSLGSPVFGVTLLLYLHFAKQEKEKTELFQGLLATEILVYILKAAVARPRPQAATEAVTLGLNTHAFPSGHTATAFLLATVLSTRKTKRYLYTLAVIVGISRIYLGAHYPSDVIAGAIIGLAAGIYTPYTRTEKKLQELKKQWVPGSGRS